MDVRYVFIWTRRGRILATLTGDLVVPCFHGPMTLHEHRHTYDLSP